MASVTWRIREWEPKTFRHPELFEPQSLLTASNDESGSESKWKLSWNNTEQDACALTLDGSIPGELYVKDGTITVDGKPSIPVEEASFTVSSTVSRNLWGQLRPSHHSGDPGTIAAEAYPEPA